MPTEDATRIALAQRYGRNPRNRRRDLIALVATLGVLAALVIGWAVWSGVGGVHSQVQTADQGSQVVGDRVLQVRWTLTAPIDRSAACTVKAVADDLTVVGWQVVHIPPAAQTTRTFTVRVRLARPATSGLIDTCWLT